MQIKSNSSSSSGTCVPSRDWAGAHGCQPNSSYFLPARPRAPAADCRHPLPCHPRVVLPSHASHHQCFPRNTRPPIQLHDARRVGLRNRVDGNLVKSYVAVIRPLAVACVPSDPEYSRPPGALSPRSTFFSDRRARDGTRRHPPHQNVSQSLSSTVNPFARGQPGCAMRTARVRGIRLPSPLPCRLPALPPTAPMSSPRATSTTPMSSSRVAPNRSHVVFPRYPQPLPCRLPALPPPLPCRLPTLPQPLPCRLATLPPTTSMSSSYLTSNHTHVVSRCHLSPPPMPPQSTTPHVAPAPQGGVI